jgi:tRNA threonylcarbamoyladenosine biosynthesis protein TsaB
LLEQPCALIVNGVATAIEPRILLVETSGRAGQIALALGDAMLAVRTLDEARRHARDLAPALAAMLTEQKWKAHDLDAVFVSRGPGSYTGLRVGIMSAKMLAYATGCALFGIQTFAAITAQAPVDAERLDILADAQQGKVYVQSFQRADGAIWQSVSQLAVRRFNDWLASRDPSAWVSGPALAIYGRSLPQNVRMVPEADWNPRAQSLLAPGLPRYRAGERDDPWTLEPLYLRPSAAEEQWNKVGKHDSVGRLS